jgi:hypothetical protein
MGIDPLGTNCQRPVGTEEQQRCIEEGVRWAAPHVQRFHDYIQSPEGREAMEQAAIVDEAIRDTASRVAPYVVGSSQIVLGCTEAAAGATVAGGSGGLAAVPGVLVMAHGADVCSTGFRTVWTGQYQETFTKQGLRAGLERAGVEPGTAEMISSHGDAAISAIGVAGSARLITLGSVVAPPVGVPSGTAGLTDDVLQLAERNLTGSGDTVLGSYPGYINRASAKGASYFDVGDAWEALTPAQRTAANNHFLDIIASRGDRVLLSVPKYQIQQGTALADEVAYLTSQKGYVWVNQWSLRPGG